MKYEIALVLSSKVDDDVRTATLERVKNRVTKSGSTISYFLHFEGPEEAPAFIERHLRIYDNVLRFLIVKQDA